MACLKDMLTSDSLSDVAENTVHVGEVYLIKGMSGKHRIIPKPGNKTRNKRFIVLGYNKEGLAYGGIIINTNINENLSKDIKAQLLPIHVVDYPFLGKDRYVDCSGLKLAYFDELKNWTYEGQIKDSDIKVYIEKLKESPTVDEDELTSFGI